MKKTGIILGAVIAGLYLLFLLLPLVVSPIINMYNQDIVKSIEEASGYKVKLDKIYLITTPKLTAGVKVKKAEFAIPSGENFLTVENFKIKISLLPLLLRKIELDKISADNINALLKVRQDGHLLIEEYLPQPDPDEPNTQALEPLPFGFKLSNHLPNLVLNNYDVVFVDMPTSKKYVFSGKNLKITDFILDKKVKLAANGSVIFDGDEQFAYDIKLLNKLMPDIQLNELVFNPEQKDETSDSAQNFSFINVIDLFKSIHRTGLTANLNMNVVTGGTFKEPTIDGNFDIEKLTISVDGKKLPEGYIKVNSKGHRLNIDGNLFSSDKESTTLSGSFNFGKHNNIDMNFKSNSQINSLFRILNSLAKSFNYNDLETLSATGSIDADFTLKSSAKHVKSSGYLNIPSATIKYPLYNVALNNINADIDFNDMLNIKNVGFEIFGQPLRIYGTIQQNADTDVHVIADKLLIKGLIAAAGQVQLLKENAFNSGTLSLDASLSGKLDKIVPIVNLSVANLDMKNIPSATRITMPSAKFVINTDGKKFTGNLSTNMLKIINPMISFSIPETSVVIGEKDIVIKKAYMMLNNSRIDLSGQVSDYINSKMKIDIKATGALLANDIKSFIPKDLLPLFGPGQGRIPLNVDITGNAKVQDIAVVMSADASNYYNLLNIAELKNHKTIIKSDIKLIDDSAKLSNTGIYVDNISNSIAKLDGVVSSLSKTQKLNLRLSVPNKLNMVIPGLPKSNMSVRGDIDITGTVENPHLKGLVSIPSITIPDMLFEMTNLVANLNGPVMKGNGTVQKMVSGGIVAENLAAEFVLKNYSVFYLNNILGDAFGGKISGNVSYGINDGKIGVNLTGSGMNAVKAIEGLSGIKNALSGVLGFKADIVTSGSTDVQMMKNLSGKVSFDIQNGKFLNVGRFDKLLYAQNILGNAVLKTLVTSVTNIPAIQNTAEFKTIDGTMTFSKGWAKINPIRTVGPLMAYYITGNYNLLNGTTNVIILGRLDAKVVAALGPLGDLSVDKLTSYIPKFGTLTGQLINAFTSDPAKEKTSNIPALSTGTGSYKDFKVEFNGGLESASSVKSFKWLSKCDVTAIDYKQEVKNTVQSFKDTISNTKKDIQDTKDAFKNSVQESKQQIEDAKQQFNELKNLFKGYTQAPSE